jgi:hypothetical protein
MSDRSDSQQTTARLSRSLQVLNEFQWPEGRFSPSGTNDPDEIGRVCRDARDEAARNCLDFTEADEDWALSRWRKYSALTERRDQFLDLCRLCYEFVIHLSHSGHLDKLADLAKIPEAPRNLGPSTQIAYQPLLPTSSSRYAYYPDAPGGNLVLGARLLWWCAAALDSIRSTAFQYESARPSVGDAHLADGEEFGYSPGFFRHIFSQPFWMRVYEEGACSFHDEALDLIQTAAVRVFDAAAKETSPTSAGREVESPASLEGVTDDMRFMQNGLDPLPLTALHYSS